jgi:hypothetical protein
MNARTTVRISTAALESALLRLQDAARIQADGHPAAAAELALVAVSDLFGAPAACAVMEEVEHERARKAG